ncbi:MAG: PAS domain S-box protein, partial [Chlorobiota bacterium]
MADRSGPEKILIGFVRSLSTPVIVVDGSGRLVSYNGPAGEMLGIKEHNTTFADLFLISEVAKVKSLLSAEDTTLFNGPLTLFLRNGQETNFTFSKATIDHDGDLYACIHLRESVSRQSEKINLKFSKRDSDEFKISSALSELINEIESSYPFTYIAKTRIQASANALDEMFWMKDSEGKYILVNDKFASFLNLKTGQMEGRSEKNFIPQFVHDFNTSFVKFLRDSNSIASLVTQRVGGIPVDTPHEILNIPLLDMDENLVAVLGIARPFVEEKPKIETLSDNNVILDDSNNFNLETVLKLKNKMYEFIVSKNPDAVFVYDLESFKFLDVNDAALLIYGYSRQEFLQMDLTDLYLPEEIQTIADSAKNEEGKFVGPFNHRKKDGSLILVEICKISFNYEGSEAHFNIVRDITGLLEKEEQLQMMRTVFEHSRDILIVTDNTGFISYVNPVVEEYLGIRRTELLNNSIVSLATENSRGDFLKKSFTPVTFTADIKKSSGEVVTTDFTSMAFQGIEGDITQIAYIGRVANTV